MVENREQTNTENSAEDLKNALNESAAANAVQNAEKDSECDASAACSAEKTEGATEKAEGAARSKIDIKQKVIEYSMRTLVLVIGLVIMSFGVGLSIQATLGTSPISSIPTVLYYITKLSVGTTTIIFNTLIVILQIIILRRRFRLIQLLQIPVCVVFGLLCDVSLSCLGAVTPQQYWAQWLICIAGILLVAIGVSFEVAANVMTLAGEGLALSVCKVAPKIKFGYAKVMCDCSFVIIAAAISLIFLHGLQGVREGTIAAAIFVGLIAKQLNKVTIPLANKFFALSAKHKNNESGVAVQHSTAKGN